MDNLTALDRILARTTIVGDCWHWIGDVDKDGYGRIRVRGRAWFVHRYAYTVMVGEIEPSLTLDHLCRNRRCVNPDHLEPVTNRENILRGESPSALNARKTKCPRGHEYDGLNSRGDRICRRCIYENNKRSRAARKARGLAA